MAYQPSDWVCTNPNCMEADIVKHGEQPADSTVLCGACQQPCEYRQPVD